MRRAVPKAQRCSTQHATWTERYVGVVCGGVAFSQGMWCYQAAPLRHPSPHEMARPDHCSIPPECFRTALGKRLFGSFRSQEGTLLNAAAGSANRENGPFGYPKDMSFLPFLQAGKPKKKSARFNYLVSPSSTWDVARGSGRQSVVLKTCVFGGGWQGKRDPFGFLIVQGKVYRMNFHGRVHCSSSKNFQLVQAHALQADFYLPSQKC